MPSIEGETREDDVIKAKYLRLICETISGLDMHEVERQKVTAAFAVALADTNPGFDRDRFYAECEPVR